MQPKLLSSADPRGVASCKKCQYIYLLVALLALSWTIPGIFSSYWLDETGTVWIIKDGFSEAVSRALTWSATSPLYYVTAWAWSQLFGLGEVSLRLLSLFLFGATSVLLFRLARRWLDDEGAALSVLLFACLPSVSFAAVDARPYALGIFFLAGCWLAWVRWVEAARWPDGVLTVVCAAGVIHSHYLLAMGLLPLPLLLHPSSRLKSQLRWPHLCAAVAGLALLVGPLVVQLMGVISQRGRLNWAEKPSLGQFIGETFAAPVASLLFLGLVISVALDHFEGFSLYKAKLSVIPMVSLAVIAPVLAFLSSVTIDLHIFVPRYIISCTLGTAVVGAWAIRSVEDWAARRTISVTIALVLAGLNIYAHQIHGGQDWRGAMAYVNKKLERRAEVPVAFVTQFIESNHPTYLHDPRFRDILLAPAVVYPIRTHPILLPVGMTPSALGILSSEVVKETKEKRSLLVICSVTCQIYVEKITGLLHTSGIGVVAERHFGLVQVVEFGEPARRESSD